MNGHDSGLVCEVLVLTTSQNKDKRISRVKISLEVLQVSGSTEENVRRISEPDHDLLNVFSELKLGIQFVFHRVKRAVCRFLSAPPRGDESRGGANRTSDRHGAWRGVEEEEECSYQRLCAGASGGPNPGGQARTNQAEVCSCGAASSGSHCRTLTFHLSTERGRSLHCDESKHPLLTGSE